MKIVAIIPAYNEEKRVAEAVADATKFVNAVIVVDDCSTDATFAHALEAGAYVLRHLINRGQGAALQTGTEFALSELGADVIVHFDADGQMQGADIPNLIEPIIAGRADVCLGSRFLGKVANMPLTRYLTLRAALLFTMFISGIKVSDTHCGFRALSAEAAREMEITMDRMAHGSEIIDLIRVKKLRFEERPVAIRYSSETLRKGQSFLSGFTILKDFFKSRFFDEL